MLSRTLIAVAFVLLAAPTAHAEEGRSPGEIAEAILGLPADAPDEQRRLLQAELAAAKQRVATVVLKVTQLDAEKNAQPFAPQKGTVLVDGKQAASLPLVRPLYLEPGKRTIAIEVPGKRYVPIEADLLAGQNVVVTLREVAPAAAPAPAAPDDKPLWPGIVLASLGAAGIGVGIGLIVVSVNKQSDAEDLGEQIGTCTPSRLDGPCTELASTVSDRNAFQNGALVSFIVGGVAAAASIVYFAIPTPRETPDAPPVAIAPILGPSAWGLSVGGAF